MKNYKKYFKISASVADVYACLTNPFTIELWSGYPAKMKAREGTEFELWDGDITGKILKIEPGKLIQEQWYFEGEEEDSIVTIKLHQIEHGVSVELHHINIPDEVYEEFVTGWEEYFFGGIKAFLEE